MPEVESCTYQHGKDDGRNNVPAGRRTAFKVVNLASAGSVIVEVAHA